MRQGCYSRQAQPSDLAELLALESQRFVVDRISERSFRRWLRLEHEGLVVTICDDALVGYLLLLRRKNSRVVRLYSIAVAAPMTGKGMGRALMKEAEAMATRWGAGHIRLEVQASNRRAIRLYNLFGYERVHDLPRYYEDGSNGLRMQKTL